MNGYGGQGMAQMVTPEQYAQALQTYDKLNQRQDHQQTMAQSGNPFALLGAALGGALGKKFGKYKGIELSDVEQQIAAFQEQKAQEMAMAEQDRAEQEYKRKLADEQNKWEREHKGKMELKNMEISAPTTMQRNLSNPVSAAYMNAQLNKSNAPVVNVNNGEKLSAMQDTLGKKNAEKYIDWENQAYAANETLAGLSKLKQISQLQNTGKVEEAKALVGQLFGTEAGANMQAFGSVASSLVLQQAEKLKGAMSDGDIKLLEATMPQFGNDPRANQVVFDVLENAAQRSIKRFNDADAYFQENGKLQGYKPEFQFARNGQQQPQQEQINKDYSKMSDEELMAAWKAKQGK